MLFDLLILVRYIDDDNNMWYFSRMSTREKNKLGRGLAKLSGENLLKALEIVAQENPSFQSTAEEVEVDIDNLVIDRVPNQLFERVVFM